LKTEISVFDFGFNLNTKRIDRFFWDIVVSVKG
jgi:hypothetical protein